MATRKKLRGVASHMMKSCGEHLINMVADGRITRRTAKIARRRINSQLRDEATDRGPWIYADAWAAEYAEETARKVARLMGDEIAEEVGDASA